MAIKYIWNCLLDPEKKLEVNSNCNLYGDKGGLKSYHYGEMLKRLNEMGDNLKKVDGDREFTIVGRFLRKLWRKHEAELMVHTRSLYGGTHEQDIKSKKMKVECFKFAKNKEGVYGIYTDLVYDTYQKDWSKAYQLTFHGFFIHIDYLSKENDGEYYSYMHKYLPYSSFGKKYRSNEIIIVEDVENLLGDKAKLDSLHGLPKHEKAPLYDVIGKVLDRNGHSNAEREQFRHGQDYWFDSGKSDPADFSKCLPIDVFAHMASTAVVNPKALYEMRKYLPNVYGMFIDILETMMFELCNHEVNRWNEKLKLLEVEEVASDKKGANPGEKVRYWVTKYNKNEVSQQDRSGVKWKIRINKYKEEEKKESDSYLQEVYGESIEIEIKENWVGKKITAIPYLNNLKEDVAVKTPIYRKSLIITTDSKVKLFTLEGYPSDHTSKEITVRELYKDKKQWFEPNADEYVSLISIEPNITSRKELKHFSWDDIVKFAEIDRWMFQYQPRGSGDWKFVKEGGDGYILVSVGGVPYWGDAIGQIPFAVDCFTDYLKEDRNYEAAKEKTIEQGKKRSNGEIIGAIRDDTNSYDNAMILRAINWASERFKLEGGKLLRTSHSPRELSKASNGKEIN